MQLAVLPVGEFIYFQADNIGAFANPVEAEKLVRLMIVRLHSTGALVLPVASEGNTPYGCFPYVTQL